MTLVSFGEVRPLHRLKKASNALHFHMSFYLIIGGLALATGTAMYAFMTWSWGPFEFVHQKYLMDLKGNGPNFDLDAVKPLRHSPLEGKTIAIVGSSLTYGYGAGGLSFVDYMARRNNCLFYKLAVSGTTLATTSPNSYVDRLLQFEGPQHLDLMAIQLSTNDATQKKLLGQVSSSHALKDFDTTTTLGALEYMIAYSQDRWQCPVVLFTSHHFDNADYAALVDALPILKKKWQLYTLDHYNLDPFNKTLSDNNKLYMADRLHPTRAGYLRVWTPQMEEGLYEVLKDLNHK